MQDDPNNPQPCSLADMAKYPGGQLPTAPEPEGGAGDLDDDAGAAPDAGCNPDFDDCSEAGKK